MRRTINLTESSWLVSRLRTPRRPLGQLSFIARRRRRRPLARATLSALKAPASRSHSRQQNTLQRVALDFGLLLLYLIFSKLNAESFFFKHSTSCVYLLSSKKIGAGLSRALAPLFPVAAACPDLFVGCGAAAGVAAGFNAPIAGIFFAIEVLSHTFK